jgi:predicted DsbA family dithiol-disulfide isomerase
MPLSVEIFSDVVCPWCYIGKRRFEAALARFVHRDDVEVTWRSFELDPDAPREADGPPAERLAAKYGTSVQEAEAMNARVSALAAADGLEYHLDRARAGNTFDAHRILHLAKPHGLAEEAEERLMRAYFSEGEPIADHETLVRLAAELGVDAREARAVLASDRYADDVREDERLAARMGIRGVPFFVLGRRFGVSGAQPADALLQALEQAWSELVETGERAA